RSTVRKPHPQAARAVGARNFLWTAGEGRGPRSERRGQQPERGARAAPGAQLTGAPPYPPPAQGLGGLTGSSSHASNSPPRSSPEICSASSRRSAVVAVAPANSEAQRARSSSKSASPIALRTACRAMAPLKYTGAENIRPESVSAPGGRFQNGELPAYWA